MAIDSFQKANVSEFKNVALFLYKNLSNMFTFLESKTYIVQNVDIQEV